MRLEIKTLRLENFKGCKDRTVEFGKTTKVFGANSMGKSTLFCAWMWLMVGVNEHLVSNPNITPLGESECVSTVTAEITIDGQPCNISKSQKYKEKFDANSEKTVSSTVNSYTVNGVEKSATAFVAEMKERGIDMDNFLMLSHVFAFTADTSKKGREEMRKVLFEMVDGISDLDIAKEMSGVAALTIELGKGYKVEEVEQMAKSSLKKLNDTYGKSGELIDAKISGMAESKVDYDPQELIAKELELKHFIKNTKEEIEKLSNSNKESRIAELEGKILESKNKAMADFYVKRNEHLNKHNDLISRYQDVETVINTANKVVFENSKDIEHKTYLLDTLRKDYEEIFASHYDGSTICPTCGQELPESMISDAKTAFEKDKARKLEDIKKSGEKLNKEIDEKEQLINDSKATISRMTPALEMLKEQLDEWEKVSITEPRLEDIPCVAEMQAKIKALKDETADSSFMRLDELNKALESVEAELIDVQGKQKSLGNNSVIEKKIADLREQKRDVEVQRAEHEKVIYEVECFKKYKNEKLSDSINSHFKIAQFRLFKVLKNGSIEDDCAVLVDGKEMNTQLNQASQILARLDIIRGLSDFKQIWFPIFLDDFALFTAESEKSITMENQLIKLIAADGYKELTVVKGD